MFTAALDYKENTSCKKSTNKLKPMKIKPRLFMPLSQQMDQLGLYKNYMSLHGD